MNEFVTITSTLFPVSENQRNEIRFVNAEKLFSPTIVKNYRLTLSRLDTREDQGLENERDFGVRMITLKNIMSDISKGTSENFVYFPRRTAPVKWRGSSVLDDYVLLWNKAGQELARVRLFLDTDILYRSKMVVDFADFGKPIPEMSRKTTTLTKHIIGDIFRLNMFPILFKEFQDRTDIHFV